MPRASSAPKRQRGSQTPARRSAQARHHRAGHREGSERQAIAGAFQEVKAGQKAAGRQAEFESRWDAAVVKNYAEAKALAEKALTAK